MLTWRNELWLIDHGASLYFHHGGGDWNEAALKPFTQIKDHVVLKQAWEIEKADSEIKKLLTEEKLRSIANLIPAAWIEENGEAEKASVREKYFQFLTRRINNSAVFITEINNARAAII
jgi:hypothetical protein